MSKSKLNNSKKYEDAERNIFTFFDEIKNTEKLGIKNLLKMKQVLNDVNNLLTYRLAVKATEWLIKEFKLEVKRNEIFERINTTSVNSNGYDIVINFDKVKIIGEVKCNVPINDSDEFGSNQENGILQDIKKLKEGNAKTRNAVNNSEFIKFMFVIDEENSKKACNKPSFKSKLEKQNVVEYTDVTFCNNNNVYLKYISF